MQHLGISWQWLGGVILDHLGTVERCSQLCVSLVAFERYDVFLVVI